MITFSSALALLIATAPLLEITSGLLAEPHQHEWTKVIGQDDELAFFDLSYTGRIEIEDVSYPVVLMRYLRWEGTPEANLTDFRFAIDCEENALAGIEVWLLSPRDGPNGVAIGRTESLLPRFETVHPQNEARVAPVFKHVCGRDWSIEPAQ